MMKHYEVVAAVIEHDGKILCMQRNKGKFDYVSYKFEFPGGKVEAGTRATRGNGHGYQHSRGCVSDDGGAHLS